MPEMYIMDNSKLYLAQHDNVLYDRLGIPILDGEGAHQHACYTVAFSELSIILQMIGASGTKHQV